MITRPPATLSVTLGLAACIGNIGDGPSGSPDLGGATETFGAPSDVRRLSLAE